MFGIPTTTLDYSMPEEMTTKFEADFEYDPSLSDEKNIYRLRKQIISACKKAGYSNKDAEGVATRNVLQVLAGIKENLANPQENQETEVVAEPVAE